MTIPRGITALAKVRVHDLALLIDRPIAVGPSAIEPAVRFIDAPLPANWSSVRAGSLHEEWQEAPHPAVDGTSVDHNPAFGEHLRNVGVTQAVADVPSDGKSDHLIGEAAARESASRACREASAALIATPALPSEPGAPVSPDGHAPIADAAHVAVPFLEPNQQ